MNWENWRTRDLLPENKPNPDRPTPSRMMVSVPIVFVASEARAVEFSVVMWFASFVMLAPTGHSGRATHSLPKD